MHLPTGRRGRWATTALLASAAGTLAMLPMLPTFLRVPLLGAFVLVAPGATLMVQVELPASTAAVVVPSFGLAVLAATTAAAALAGWWSPQALLALIVAGCLLGLGRAWPQLIREVRA